jgi:hypothetical protein
MCKKILFVTGFFILVGFLFNFDVSNAKALTLAEIRALIQQLQQQIAQLQQQLAEVEEGPEVWCHDFKVKLRYGNTGNEVLALQAALEKEGFSVSDSEKQGVASFGDHTTSAVVGFQEKYKEEVLSPWGLKYGTGYVGSTTLAKLDELYGCKEEEKTTCKPKCSAIGTRSEGWYDSCTNKLIKYANCKGCEAVCRGVGTRSEGWYDSCGVGATGIDLDALIKYTDCEESTTLMNLESQLASISEAIFQLADKLRELFNR